LFPPFDVTVLVARGLIGLCWQVSSRQVAHLALAQTLHSLTI
jgi:hypothetical protein